MREKAPTLPRQIWEARQEAFELIAAADPKDYERLAELRALLCDNCVDYVHTDAVEAIDAYFKSQQAEA